PASTDSREWVARARDRGLRARAGVSADCGDDAMVPSHHIAGRDRGAACASSNIVLAYRTVFELERRSITRSEALMSTVTAAVRTYTSMKAAWIPLAALCLAFFVEMVDNTLLSIALP